MSSLICEVRDDTEAEMSHWLRNKCFDGFVTVKQRRVLAQHEGVNKHSPQVQIVKEICTDLRNPHKFELVIIRLFNPHSNRYICFNKRGKVKSMSRRRAEKMGYLCGFIEDKPRDRQKLHHQTSSDLSLYVHLRSVYNNSWYLGFNGRKRRISHLRDGNAISLPRTMFKSSSRRSRKFKASKCDFLFTTGVYTKEGSDWSGLFDRVKELNDEFPYNPVPRHQIDNRIIEKEKAAISGITQRAEARRKHVSSSQNFKKNSRNEVERAQDSNDSKADQVSDNSLHELVDNLAHDLESLEKKVKEVAQNSIVVPESEKMKKKRQSWF